MIAHRVCAAALLLVAAIHLLPLAGVLGAAQLQKLYGITIDSPDLAILLRHRAVLFGMLGLYLVRAAFVPRLHGGALLLAATSVVSFLLLAWIEGAWNAAIGRVVAADLVALAALCVGALSWLHAVRSAAPAAN